MMRSQNYALLPYRISNFTLLRKSCHKTNGVEVSSIRPAGYRFGACFENFSIIITCRFDFANDKASQRCRNLLLLSHHIKTVRVNLLNPCYLREGWFLEFTARVLLLPVSTFSTSSVFSGFAGCSAGCVVA